MTAADGSVGSGGAAGWSVATRAVHAGLGPDPGSGAIAPPLITSSIYDLDHPAPYSYGREHNPTWERLEAALGALEGGGGTVVFGSGIAAISAVMATLPEGAVVVAPVDAYGGTRTLLGELEAAGRLRARLVQTGDTDEVVRACEGAKLVCLETLTNPLLRVPDVAQVAAAAHAAGAALLVDNTFATPILHQPLRWGADLVVHSASKYIGGHSDCILGAAVAASPRAAEALRRHRHGHGAIPGQLEAWLALRGLRTLALRVPRQMATAAWLAARLAADPRVRRVHHPSLPTHPDHDRARRQLHGGFGAVVSVELDGSAEDAEAVCRAAELWTHATSLGAVESTLERRARWAPDAHLPPSLLRLSVGIEDKEDLLRDLGQAIARGCAGRASA
ncbi:MAG TPA: PLP-dependent transferase [Candidatus Micrarchaeia archaeon]|nr:PLP-dependent transferase [Candidatus Micrarchaeia archaeon]